MKNICFLLLAAGTFVACDAPKPPAPPVAEQKSEVKTEGNAWLDPFDGKTLSGWKSVGQGEWTMRDGILFGKGPTCHLYSPETYTNLEFKAEIKLNHEGNSGMYFRAAIAPEWPDGYEAQAENSSPDPSRTGSLYHFTSITQQLVPDDTWWTQHIVAISNRLIIKINDKITTDGMDSANTYVSGHLAFQQHNLGSEVQFRNVRVKRLPTDPFAAMAEAKKDLPELK